VIGARFGDYIYDCPAGAPEFGAIGVCGYAELLHDFVGKLVGRAVEAASLSVEGIVEVTAID
jgi:hypothetical protein